MTEKYSAAAPHTPPNPAVISQQKPKLGTSETGKKALEVGKLGEVPGTLNEKLFFCLLACLLAC